MKVVGRFPAKCLQCLRHFAYALLQVFGRAPACSGCRSSEIILVECFVLVCFRQRLLDVQVHCRMTTLTLRPKGDDGLYHPKVMI